MKRLIVMLIFLSWAPAVCAQYYINQKELADILTPCSPELDRLPQVTYRNVVLFNSRNNSVLARNTFYKIIGKGDVELGKHRSKLVGLLNRTLMPRAKIGDTLIVPSVFLDDFCAYSPFPKWYPGGVEFDKLFFIDKSVQAWAAYEKGKLVRWGIVNTGAKSSPTPNGRFNFNWKTEYRISTLSPPGERWEMYWVFNFHEGRGIHIHQYPMPTGGPTSHGCVRVVEEDAQWIYTWADSWKKTKGSGYRSGRGKIRKPGTTVLVIGKDPPGNPHPFIVSGRRPTLRKIVLPRHPFDIPPGSSQQKYFDRRRPG